MVLQMIYEAPTEVPPLQRNLLQNWILKFKSQVQHAPRSQCEQTNTIQRHHLSLPPQVRWLLAPRSPACPVRAGHGTQRRMRRHRTCRPSRVFPEPGRRHLGDWEKVSRSKRGNTGSPKKRIFKLPWFWKALNGASAGEIGD